MKVIRFNRHTSMSMETLREIGDIMREMKPGLDTVTNMLYGLYDGYLYSNILIEAQKSVSPLLYFRIVNVVNKVKTYERIKI